MNRLTKRILKVLGIIIGFFVLVYVVLYVYVTSHKQSILKKVSSQISTKLNGEVTIKNAELNFFKHFPNMSVEIDGITIKDTMYPVHKHIFFQAEKVFVMLNIRRLIKQKDAVKGLTFQNASLYLYTDTSGYSNDYLLEGKKDSTKKTDESPSEILLEQVNLRNVHVVIDHRRKERMIDLDITKLNCDINGSDSILKLGLDSKILIHQLGFNLAKGAYVKEKALNGQFEISFNRLQKQLFFDDIDLEVGDHPFTFSGRFNFDEERKYNLTISTKKIDVAFGRSLLTDKISRAVSVATIEKPVDVQAKLVGTLKPGEPLVNVSWQVKNNHVQTPVAAFANTSFEGSYTNQHMPSEPKSDENSRIEVHGFTGTWEGIELRSKQVFIDNLVTPLLTCDLKSDFDLVTLNNLLQSSALQLTEGKGQLNITYKGPLNQHGTITPIANGTITLQKGKLLYVPHNITLQNCSGTIVFQGADVAVENMYCEAEGNKINMKGSAKQLLAFIKVDPAKINLDWSISSPSLNLEPFAPLLQSRSKIAAKKTEGRFGETAQELDDMLEKANINVNLTANEIKYKRFTGTALQASVRLVEENWMLNKVALQHGGGSMQMSGSLLAKSKQFHEVNLKVELNNIDVNRIMYAFNNFGQDGIASENLKGSLTADVNVQMNLDRNARLASNMDGVVNFSLKNGGLINYQPIQKVQTFFKNRDFKHIYFAELKNRLDIKDKEITINRMEIQSTAVTMFVEGFYSMKGNTDITIQVPVSNLKKRDEDYVPENTGVDTKTGMSVFLHGTPGPDGNIKFSYSLTNKKGKKKKGNSND